MAGTTTINLTDDCKTSVLCNLPVIVTELNPSPPPHLGFPVFVFLFKDYTVHDASKLEK